MNRVRHPYVPQMVAQNAILLFLPLKFNVCRKQSAAKFFLCENFQQQRCSYIIPLSNGP